MCYVLTLSTIILIIMIKLQKLFYAKEFFILVKLWKMRKLCDEKKKKLKEDDVNEGMWGSGIKNHIRQMMDWVPSNASEITSEKNCFVKWKTHFPSPKKRTWKKFFKDFSCNNRKKAQFGHFNRQIFLSEILLCLFLVEISLFF